MNKLLATLLCLLSFNAFSFDDEQCLEIYRSSLDNIVQVSESFNKGLIPKEAFIAEVVKTSTDVTAIRSVCYFVESPSNKKCVARLKSAYDKQRAQINLVSVAFGNQTKVRILKVDHLINNVGNLVHGCF